MSILSMLKERGHRLNIFKKTPIPPVEEHKFVIPTPRVLRVNKPPHDMYGITRMKYKRNANGWWVRLAWKNKLPQFQQSILDSQFNDDPELSLKHAQTIRDIHYKELCEAGLIKQKRGPNFIKSNSSGIVGVRRVRSANGWQVSWVENGKAKCTHFAPSRYGGMKDAFYQAVLLRYKMECKWYERTLIDIDNWVELYKTATMRYMIQ